MIYFNAIQQNAHLASVDAVVAKLCSRVDRLVQVRDYRHVPDALRTFHLLAAEGCMEVFADTNNPKKGWLVAPTFEKIVGTPLIKSAMAKKIASIRRQLLAMSGGGIRCLVQFMAPQDHKDILKSDERHSFYLQDNGSRIRLVKRQTPLGVFGAMHWNEIVFQDGSEGDLLMDLAAVAA